MFQIFLLTYKLFTNYDQYSRHNIFLYLLQLEDIFNVDIFCLSPVIVQQ